MHHSSKVMHGNAAHGLPRVGASVALLLLGLWAVATLAREMPGIIRQIARPCAGCYLGAFGPPLVPYGRPFAHGDDPAPRVKTPPAEMDARLSDDNRRDAQPGGAKHWLVLNDASAGGQISLFGAGAIGQNAAAVLALTDGGIAREIRAGDVGLRYASAVSQFRPAALSDHLMNPGPMTGDPGNPMPARSVPGFHFYPASNSAAAVLVDLPSGSRAAALGADTPWNDTRRTELAGYRGSENAVLSITGHVPATATRWIHGSIPYWHVAVQKDLERHFLQIGTYGLSASAASGGAGTTDTFTDVAADASYQFIVNPGVVVSDILSAHATVIHEVRSLGASNRILGANGFDTLDTFRANASWSIADAVTTSMQYFRTAGSVEAVRYAWPGGRPNSVGIIAEVAYVPWGMPESPLRSLNLRFAAQYVAYTQLNGTERGASGNNAVYLTLWGALRF